MVQVDAVFQVVLLAWLSAQEFLRLHRGQVLEKVGARSVDVKLADRLVGGLGLVVAWAEYVEHLFGAGVAL